VSKKHPKSIGELEIGEFYSHDDLYALSDIFAYGQNKDDVLIRACGVVVELRNCHNDWYRVLARYDEVEVIR